jgi:hypothetical protein
VHVGRVLAGLLDPHVPLHQAAHLPLGVATLHHALHELVVLLLAVTESFFDSNEMTGSRSSTWLNIRFSITSRIFS